MKALYGIEPAPAVPHIRREKYLSFADDLKFSPVQINRISLSLSAEKDYLSAAEIALSASAILVSRTKNIPAGEMFDKLKSSLKSQYRSYADKGKLPSKISEFDKLKKTVDFKLRRNAFSESEIKDISKSLFECADCALRCHTECFLTEKIEQTEQQVQNIEENTRQILMT